jgi:hypothetical protein
MLNEQLSRELPNQYSKSYRTNDGIVVEPKSSRLTQWKWQKGVYIRFAPYKANLIFSLLFPDL